MHIMQRKSNNTFKPGFTGRD